MVDSSCCICSSLRIHSPSFCSLTRVPVGPGLLSFETVMGSACSFGQFHHFVSASLCMCFSVVSLHYGYAPWASWSHASEYVFFEWESGPFLWMSLDFTYIHFHNPELSTKRRNMPMPHLSWNLPFVSPALLKNTSSPNSDICLGNFRALVL